MRCVSQMLTFRLFVLFFFLSSPLIPVSCSSLSFLVKLEQLDLGGNDLEVLVGEGWWGGNMGGWQGQNPVPLWKQVVFLSEIERNRPSGCLGRFWSAHHGLVIVPSVMFPSCVGPRVLLPTVLMHNLLCSFQALLLWDVHSCCLAA